MLITSSTAALHRHGCCGSRYLASSKDHKKRSQEKQTHRNYGARKSEEREREELQTLINYSGSSPRAEWPFSAHAQELQAPISFASCFFPELGGYLIFERTVILVVFKLHIKILRT
jgi:hypothetical protein